MGIERVPTLLGVAGPVSQGVGAVSTAYVDASKFEVLYAVVQAGVLGAGATLDVKLEQATTVGGAGNKDVVGGGITQFVKATNDNNQAVIVCQTEDLDVEGGFRWVRATATVAVAASLISVALYGTGGRYQPGVAPATLVQTKIAGA